MKNISETSEKFRKEFISSVDELNGNHDLSVKIYQEPNKNIYVLPTNKPSRLFRDNSKKLFLKANQIERNLFDNQFIYITKKAEKINEENWYINNGVIFRAADVFDEGNNPNNSNQKVKYFNEKIVLTDDSFLIADGVQSIDNEFLEWFVENSNCGFVEVKKGFADGTAYGYNFLDYKIIIPKNIPTNLEPQDMIESVSIGEETVDIHHKQPPTNLETDEFVSKDILNISNFEKYLKDNDIKLTDENRYNIIANYLQENQTKTIDNAIIEHFKNINTNKNYIICYKDEYYKLPKILREGRYGSNGSNPISEFIFVEDLLNEPDESITDVNLIRTIASWGIRNNSNILYCKIKTELQFAGLYPHIQIHNINPNINKNE